jgi:hypothetical protein
MLNYLEKPEDAQDYLLLQSLLLLETPKSRSQGNVEEESESEEYEDNNSDEEMEEAEDEKLTPLINHFQVDTLGSYDLLTKMNFDKVSRFRFNVPL